MTYARLVDVKFRPGKREEGMSIIADVGKGVRDGFEGMLILLATDDADKVTYVSLWDSEETMRSSWTQISPKVIEALKEYLAEPVAMKSTTVREAQKISIPA